jgi:predicted DNA-binding transcriptional regulator YafY
MSRATKADKTRLLNAAYELLEHERADAAQRLTRRFGLSRRQAYRYLEEASSLRAPLPVVEPTVAVTFKLPMSTVRALHAYARRRRLTLSEIVTQALAAFLGAVRRRG